MKQYLPIFLSFLPVACLILVSLLKNIKVAALSAFVLTSGIFFFWESSLSIYGASLISAFIATLNILLVVVGAVFLFNVMEASKIIDEIKNSLTTIHPSREVLFFFISMSLTGFFEGIAGFGTPGAIVPPILISMGFNPIMSIAAVLLFDSVFAVFGAVGTPLVAGMQTAVGVSDDALRMIGFYAAISIVVVGVLFLFFLFMMYVKNEKKMEHKSTIILLYLFFAIPFIAFAWFMPELATVLSSAVLLIASIIYLTKGKVRLALKPWIPYMLLVVLLILPKAVKGWGALLEYDIGIKEILGTAVSADFKPLKSPLLPFLIIGIYVLSTYRNSMVKFKPIGMKVLNVFMMLFPIIAVSQLMVNSGTGQPSMVNVISHSFVWTDRFYVIIAPYIGIMGSFITGTTTVSNIIFSASQLEVSEILSFNSSVILALQHSGAAIGNAVCLFNIVAAASVVGIKEENKILSKTLAPTLLGGLLIGLTGYLLIVALKI